MSETDTDRIRRLEIDVVHLQGIVDKYEALRQADIEAAHTANQLALVKVDQHLERLNGEHNTLDKMSETYVKSAVFEVIHNDFIVWRASIDQQIANVKGRIAAYASVGAVAFVIYEILAKVFKW